MNVAVMIGRLTAEPEMKKTQSGLSVLSFTVAVNRGYVKAGEEKQTDFIDCVAWRQQAEFISRYFHKGSMIAIQGEIQTRNWEDKNGSKHKATEIVVSNVSFCESKNVTGAVKQEDEMKEVPEYDLPF